MVRATAWFVVLSVALPVAGLAQTIPAADAEPAATTDRLPVPAKDASMAAGEAIRETYRAKFRAAKTQGSKEELANFLLQLANGTQGNPAKRYALLTEAGRLALEAKNARLAITVAAEIEKAFQVEPWRLRVTVMGALRKSVRMADQRKVWVESVLEAARQAGADGSYDAAGSLLKLAANPMDRRFYEQWTDAALSVVDETVAADRYDLAAGLLALASDTVAEAKDKDPAQRVQARAVEIQQLAGVYANVKEALGVLARDPTDAGANLVVGKYQCFGKGDWKTGLPMLQKGDDPELKDLATLECSGKTDAATRLALADGWWEQAEVAEEPAKRRMVLRACQWYVGTTLEQGPEKDRAEQRLAVAKLWGIDPCADRLATGEAATGEGDEEAALGERRGETPGSEAAVAAALNWLAEHQMPDGGWSFDHHQHPNCAGRCGNPGTLGNDGRVAATALGLLPFLGAGHTHKEGPYQETVRNGLKFLVFRMKETPAGGSLYEKGGSMYSHGLASIVLCEAYAMTSDRWLKKPAEQAIRFICYAQDPVGGGWRYYPRSAGDTSVLGWQVLALLSGQAGQLKVPPLVLKKASTFLDGLQANGGANYGYKDPGSGQATTAIGLLCRMRLGLGWKRDDPRLQRGVKWLSTQGPSKGNMYYNYYATQVMLHYDSEHEQELWNKWNDVMRDRLVNSQVQQGHEAGSWHQKGDHGADRGGRLYVTAMSAMILEVYYRQLSIYRK